jgi:hypothetical protein
MQYIVIYLDPSLLIANDKKIKLCATFDNQYKLSKNRKYYLDISTILYYIS